MRPLRHEQHHEVVHDGWTGQPHVVGQQTTDHVLTDEGEVRSLHVTHTTACACGCANRPVGGFCAVDGCGVPVCERCFSSSVCRCGACLKPVCPAHAVRRAGPTGNTVTLCAECDSTLTRQRVVRQVLRALLSPFLRWEDHHGSR